MAVFTNARCFFNALAKVKAASLEKAFTSQAAYDVTGARSTAVGGSPAQMDPPGSCAQHASPVAQRYVLRVTWMWVLHGFL